MSCECETKCFTITWKIENFSAFSSEKEMIRSPVWKTETTEDYAWWRFLLKTSGSFLEFRLTSFTSEMKDRIKHEMSLLTSSGEIKLCQVLCNDDYCCSYKIEKTKIFGAISDSLLLQGTLTLCCRIWLQKLKPGRGQCFLRTALHEVNFRWVIEGFSLDPYSKIRSLHDLEKFMFTTSLYKLTYEEGQESTHQVRIELLPDYGKFSTFISFRIDIGDDIGKVISTYYDYPVVGWESDVAIDPKKCPNGHLLLDFKCLIAVEHPKSPDAAVGSSSTLSRDLLQLYRKKTLRDVTINTDEDASLSAHKNILAARSRVFEAMFERDQTVEGHSGVVDIDDVDRETMDWLLVYLYSDSLKKELRWEQASSLYYAADKYAVLPLKQECARVLMVTMTADNVCDILILADRHSDEPLMSCAVDFVRYNQKVISSPAWENLEKRNAQLTTKVLRQILLQKDKK